MSTESGLNDARALNRQEQIWTALYGPSRARQMLDSAAELRRADPKGDLAAIFRSVEPDEDSDVDEAGTMRPGFG